DSNIVWDSSIAFVRAENIVWSTDAVWAANIVWADRVIGEMNGDNIVWGSADGDNIVWGSLNGDNVVWGTFAGDNIVWGTCQRELRVSDAPSLFVSLTTQEVARFISPPPTTIEGFERFIAWAHRQRAAGQYVCFAVVARSSDVAIGLFQIRSLDADFGTAEWG